MAESFVLNTGARIPSVGLGTAKTEPGTVGEAVYAAVKAGYRHIDCAPAYRNEKEIHAPVRTKKGAIRTAENYIPLDVPDTWGAMEKLYDSGKARAIGVSNFSCKRMEDLLAIARIIPAVNQVESHPGWQQMKLRELCQSKGIHISAYSPLGRPGSSAFTGPSFLSNHIIISIAEKLQKSPAQVALRWGLQMGQSVLPKSINDTRIKENFNIFDWSIHEDLLSRFSEIPQIKTLRAEFVVHRQGIY